MNEGLNDPAMIQVALEYACTSWFIHSLWQGRTSPILFPLLSRFLEEDVERGWKRWRQESTSAATSARDNTISWLVSAV